MTAEQNVPDDRDIADREFRRGVILCAIGLAVIVAVMVVLRVYGVHS